MLIYYSVSFHNSIWGGEEEVIFQQLPSVQFIDIRDFDSYIEWINLGQLKQFPFLQSAFLYPARHIKVKYIKVSDGLC